MFNVRLSIAAFAALAVACGGVDPGGNNASGTGADDAHSTTSTTKSAPLPDAPEFGGATSADGGAVFGGANSTGNPSGTSGDGSAVAPVSAPPAGIQFRGVNLAGAEFSYSAIPGTEGVDYGWPTHAEVDYFTAHGMNTFRVGFLWERMQAKANGPLTAAYVAKLDDIVAYATAHGANVILNPHNFAKYYGSFVGSAAVPNAAFADFWSKLAARYADNERLMFNLMNEPNGLPTEQWVAAANAAIAAIRKAGAHNLIHVPGNAWTGAHSWSESWYGTPNATAMLAITDPASNYVYEVHQYLDATSGGVVGDCVSATIGTERLAGWLDWLRKNGKRGFVGEFAGGNNPLCQSAVDNMLKTIEGAADVLAGWLWWAAGPRWNPTYAFSIEPKDGEDAPQFAWLSPYLP
jgi:endoglucanase